MKKVLTAIFVELLVTLIVAAGVLSWRQSKEDARRRASFEAVQAVIASLPDRQAEIEGWGYEVSVLPKIEEEPEYDDPLLRYYWHANAPVLVLTNKNGGRYFFYYGFDQYAEKVSRPGEAKLYSTKETAAVRREIQLEMSKNDIYAPPLRESDSYDVEVEVTVDCFDPDSGEELFVQETHFLWGDYCSSRFTDCEVGAAKSKTVKVDNFIKRWYSTEELLAFYQQGLLLEEKLFALNQPEA